jgi:hypothetical protein
MKNITLSVDDRVLAAVRRYAAEHDSSVNGIVREFLNGIADRRDRAKKARARISALSRCSRARVGKIIWSREDLHDR